MCSGSKSIWRRSYIAAANGWTSWPGISLGSRIAAESFSGADAVPGFYGKPDAVYRLRRRSRIIALHIVRTSKHPLSACVCGCLRTFEPLWADVCGCLRTRPKCLGMTCRCVCECLRPRKTVALHAVTCLRMSAEGETIKNFYFWQIFILKWKRLRGPKQILPASKLMHIEPMRLLHEDQDGLWLLRWPCNIIMKKKSCLLTWLTPKKTSKCTQKKKPPKLKKQCKSLRSLSGHLAHT